jgi:DNA replication protein DnaC
MAKTDVLILDDYALAPFDSGTRADLLEVIDDPADSKDSIITSQLPVEHWHSWIGDATIADLMLARLLQATHRIVLKGDSIRRPKAKPTGEKSTPSASET